MTKATNRQPQTVQLELPAPIQAHPEVYVPRHVDLQLTPDQGVRLRQLFEALDRRKTPEGTVGYRLANGRRVQNPTDAVRWLLEQLPEASGG